MPTLLGAQLNTLDLETVGGSNSVNDFRLSLDSASTVTTTDMTGKSAVYMTPFTGNRISLYTGSAWSILVSAQVSYTLSALTSGKNYDLFAYNSAGTLTLEAVAWTDDTTRATALAYQDGIACKTGTLTKRYVGTFRTTSATTTEDSEKKRFLYNAANRRPRPLKSPTEGSDVWTYTTDAFRSANNSTTNRAEFVLGLSEEPVYAMVRGIASVTAEVAVTSGIGLDSTSTNSATLIGKPVTIAGKYDTPTADYEGFPSVGYHYLQWLERSTASGTTSWYGDAGVTGSYQAGLMGRVWA